MTTPSCNLSCASNEELLAKLKGALAGEREQLVEFLRVLAEIDERRLFLEIGFSSLFAYCTTGLGLSEDQAFRRVAVARVARDFPGVLPMIANGELHMSGVAKLAKYLTADNHDALFEAARNKSKSDIELLIATWFPIPSPPTSIRRQADASLALDVVRRDGPAITPHPSLRPVVRPTSAVSYTFRFAGTANAKALLDRATDLLAHQRPGADVGEVFELALEVLVEKLEKQKFKTTDRPRTPSLNAANPGTRQIPSAVKRAVQERDGGRCRYVSPEGRRCDATGRLEFDHVQPVARGGKSTVENIRLLCRAHNHHAAEKIFGRKFMAHRRPPARRPSDPSAPTLPGPSAVEVTPRDVKEEVYAALRALEFSVRDTRRLIKLVDPEMDGRATAEAWVCAALRKSRVDVALFAPF